MVRRSPDVNSGQGEKMNAVHQVAVTLTVAAALGAVTACKAEPSDEERAIQRAKAAVADSTREPEATRFRKLRAQFRPAEGRWLAGWQVCGEANGKNEFGGYDGYDAFRFADPVTRRPDEDPFISFRRDEKDVEARAVWDARAQVECDGASDDVVERAVDAQLDKMEAEVAAERLRIDEEWRRLTAD